MTISAFDMNPRRPGIRVGQNRRPLGGRSKRVMDLTVALIALVLATPVMLAITLLILVTDGAPAIFSHTRVGFNGKRFACYKFRTMVANADQVLADYIANNPEAAKEWEQNWKFKNDPRITFLGHILRKSSLDELPQLINVLRGDMSCVGPRPVVPDELQRYGACAIDYLRTRPGLTGLWQVTGRDAIDYPSRVSIDSRYVRNWSMWVDVVILARTIFAVMKFDNAS
ncbi:sugar transferase [Mesorhizobium captivum]|uniref:sugar transferase n=1 Tax=Mesorhizobium captivum TaxID=3072319 RepID=UPI002A246270|nr:sugar transferase [Mesorhizobium sp. VK23E]MDX8513106.1 sugar transferase [Mesorhizobium sp. VK23E]